MGRGANVACRRGGHQPRGVSKPRVARIDLRVAFHGHPRLRRPRWYRGLSLRSLDDAAGVRPESGHRSSEIHGPAGREGGVSGSARASGPAERGRRRSSADRRHHGSLRAGRGRGARRALPTLCVTGARVPGAALREPLARRRPDARRLPSYPLGARHLRRGCPGPPWMFAIARNSYLDHLRREQVRRAHRTTTVLLASTQPFEPAATAATARRSPVRCSASSRTL